MIAARLRGRRGDAAAALAGAREAIDYTRSVGDLSNLSYALHDSVLLFVEHGRPSMAAEVAGALDTGALRTMSYSHGPSEYGRRAEARERARAALGDEEFEAANRRGATMPHDDIALRALAELDALLQELD